MPDLAAGSRGQMHRAGIDGDDQIEMRHRRRGVGEIIEKRRMVGDMANPR